MKIWVVIVLLTTTLLSAEESQYFGTTANGRLENGVQLPGEGSNFTSYSTVARLLGRTYVHSQVRRIVVSAYRQLEREQPNKVYMYAETGFKNGGQFKPHKTHRNGLSVDFMTPVLNSKGESVHLPTHALNSYGYDIEFDESGQYEDFTIDYDALAAHIVWLHKESLKLGHDLWRVIFDPQLQPHLYKTQYASYLKKNIEFSKKKSWVRHDEHYHIDFEVQCD